MQVLKPKITDTAIKIQMTLLQDYGMSNIELTAWCYPNVKYKLCAEDH